MWTVGIETSCPQGSIALLCDDDIVIERTLSREGRRHARTLVDELRRMLRDAGISARQCDLVAVGRGPGSFTGLRIGVMCAKTWAYATGCPLVGVDTLQAVAESTPPHLAHVDVVAEAQRNELYLGQYDCMDNRAWTPAGPIRIVSESEWLRELPPDRQVSGPALVRLQRLMTHRDRLAPESVWFATAAGIARLGRIADAMGQTIDPWSLAPHYLRRSAAEEKVDAGPTGDDLPPAVP